MRAGLHTGECEVRGDDIGGIAVHIGARVSALAGPDEVLVSSTLRDLVIGSGLEFEDRGTHELQRGARRMASLRRRLYIAVGFGETHVACRKRVCTRWHRLGNEHFRRTLLNSTNVSRRGPVGLTLLRCSRRRPTR